MKQAVKERLIPYNPCENCRIPPKDKKEMTILPPEKIGRYLQEAEKYGVRPMFYLELSSGLRRGDNSGTVIRAHTNRTISWMTAAGKLPIYAFSWLK